MTGLIVKEADGREGFEFCSEFYVKVEMWRSGLLESLLEVNA